MDSVIYKKISEQVNLLPFDDRLRLLEQIAQSLYKQDKPKEKTNGSAFDKAFGLWKNRDIDLESIRKKAWGRTDI